MTGMIVMLAALAAEGTPTVWYIPHSGIRRIESLHGSAALSSDERKVLRAWVSEIKGSRGGRQIQ